MIVKPSNTEWSVPEVLQVRTIFQVKERGIVCRFDAVAPDGPEDGIEFREGDVFVLKAGDTIQYRATSPRGSSFARIEKP